MDDTPIELENPSEEVAVEIEPSSGAARLVMEKFRTAQTSRYAQEERWLRAYRNYRGIYGEDTRFTSTEKSRVFVKVTKTKVLAAYGQIIEVLLGGNRFPLSINPTKLPDGVEESVHIETNEQLKSTPAFKPLAPGEIRRKLGVYEEQLKDIDVSKGPGKGPTQTTLFPAQEAAKKMQKKIHDQLEESQAKKHLRKAAFECSLFGTGIMKGPFIVDKEYPKWSESGNYEPLIKQVPKISAVSVWDFFPDPDAYTMEEAQYVVERHKMSRADLRALKKRPLFDEEQIELAISYGPQYTKEYYETLMEDDAHSPASDRYDVYEFWGYVDRDVVESYDIDLTKQLKDKTEACVNIWVCNGEVLKLTLNPFKPTLIPYYVVPYEINPYSIFGIGVAENMEDTQVLMNGFMRMAVDNAALSGNLLIEIDETALEPGQTPEVYPGKIFKRQAGAPGQAIFGTKFPNVANENMQLFDKARVLADESTGFPSFAHGQTGIQGVGRTASGISMLMSAAHGSIRTVVKNVDDYLLAPLGRALYFYNMQYDFDKEFVGDLEVKATGTESLMADEVRSQRLLQFLQVVQNPVLAPFAKMDYIIREIALSMDLDPDLVTNSMSEAAIQAELLKKFSPQQPPAGAVPGGPPGANPQDTAGGGGGNIGTGTAPLPGEQGFSGTPGGQGVPPEGV